MALIWKSFGITAIAVKYNEEIYNKARTTFVILSVSVNEIKIHPPFSTSIEDNDVYWYTPKVHTIYEK